MPEFWDRPGVERPHELNCQRVSTAEVAERPRPRQPHRLRVRRREPARHLALPPRRRRAGRRRLHPPPRRPGRDRDPARRDPRRPARAEHRAPLRARRRRHSARAAPPPPSSRFDLFCWDDENDTMVIDGGGPGQHLDAPQTIAGGNGGGTHGPTWRYRTATSRGEESTTIWVTDDLGARSDATPLTVQVGPDVDRLPECAPNPGFADPNAAVPPDLRPPRRDPPLRRGLLGRRPRPADRARRDAARPRRADQVRVHRAPRLRLGQRALGRRRLPPRRQLARAGPVHRRRRGERPHERDQDGDRRRRRAALVQRPRLRHGAGTHHRRDARAPCASPAPTTTATRCWRRSRRPPSTASPPSRR